MHKNITATYNITTD